MESQPASATCNRTRDCGYTIPLARSETEAGDSFYMKGSLERKSAFATCNRNQDCEYTINLVRLEIGPKCSSYTRRANEESMSRVESPYLLLTRKSQTFHIMAPDVTAGQACDLQQSSNSQSTAHFVGSEQILRLIL